MTDSDHQNKSTSFPSIGIQFDGLVSTRRLEEELKMKITFSD
jgi:hypothetical protein